MKRLCRLLCALLLLAACLSFAACGGEGSTVFALLSVRIRGNGDGTVTAVARNEFALGSAVIPVSLTLYRVSDAQDLSLRAVAASAQTDDLNFLASLEASAAVEGTAYYYAEIVYSVYGEEEVLASELVCYDAEGNRVGEPRG